MQGSGRNDPAYDAESAYTKAARAELAKDYDSAFRLYLQSAQAYLHIGRSVRKQEKEKLQWKARAEKALERAEKIKAFAERSKNTLLTGLSRENTPGPSRSTGEAIILTPVGINPFSVQEQSFVLKKGSKVNGLNFPLWADLSSSSSPPTAQFRDPDGQPTLSPEQTKFLPIWRRPQSGQETTSSAPAISSSREREKVPEILPENIIQNIVTDCSVCASISVCLEHARRFGTNLAKASVCTEESQSSAAPGNRNRYDIKLLFNGAWRRIVIDDMLPYRPEDGNLLCMSAVPSNSAKTGGTKESVLWPSLLEKGYMKLMGGYDFPGSNSSIDLHALAGWIPEHIEIRSALFEREKTWDRIVDGFYSGKCIFTLGTSPREGIFWQNTELLPSHSYAVIDVFDGEMRGVTVLNSWVNPSAEDHPTRMLQIPWSDVLHTFDGIYLSWDPRIWHNTLTVHHMWRRGVETEHGSSQQLQAEFNNPNGLEEEVWFLLTRHVSETRRTSDFISLRAEAGDSIPAGGINSYSTVDIKGTYTNSTHTLARVIIPSSQVSGFLSVLASYDGEAREVGFTLTVYASSRMNIAWDERVHSPPFTVKVDGALTTKNAGGNWSYPTYMLNPQYLLRINPKVANTPIDRGGSKAKVTFTLQTKKEIPVNVLVVWSQGIRISEPAEQELAASSGAYCYGLARIKTELAPGTYAVIPSAFEPHHLGPYFLKVDSSHPIELTLIPQEGAGMYTKILRGAWDKQTAGGSPSFERYSQNPIFVLDIPSLTQLRIRLQLTQASNATPLNVTIYPADAGRNFLKHIATSGDYDDAISGVVTPQIPLNTGQYWVVPSTYNPGVEASFQLVVYTSTAGIKFTEPTR